MFCGFQKYLKPNLMSGKQIKKTKQTLIGLFSAILVSAGLAVAIN